jgi:GntR family transcriptional regulator, transcriptional repressor for pyruvate dehydrogenase complex
VSQAGAHAVGHEDGGRPPGRRDARLSRKVQSAPQQVATAIKEAILEGSLPPGSRLPPEQQMAANFGVSRPTVREALRTLKTAGVIRATRGRGGGHNVSDLPGSSLALGMGEHLTLAVGAQELTYRDIFEVRSELEVLSAGAAAEHRTGEDLAALTALQTLLPAGDPSTWTVPDALRYDLAFHRQLAACSHNPLILAFVSATIIAFQACGMETLGFTAPTVLAHLDLVREAVVAGDADAARAAMARHLALSGPLCGTGTSPC